jgi:phosphate acetyltransferase
MNKILFPEADNEYIIAASEQLADVESVLQKCEPVEACEKLRDGEVDAIVAGIDYSSRDIILAAKDTLGLSKPEVKLFTSLFVAVLPDGRKLILSDGATCKHPTVPQLADIIRLTAEASAKLLDEEPRIALLSFSTFGSGGHDDTIDLMRDALALYREKYPNVAIDGEMQLDAAINLRIGQKKAPNSPVAGRANVLIVPDINSGNILYKSIEQFAGATVAGPILLGFAKPVSDLSRGSTVEDIILTTKSLLKLI